MRLSGMSDLPGHARVWIFGANRVPVKAELTSLLNEVESFLERWNAHGTALVAASEWLEGRFLVVAADEAASPPSGCSIDSLVGVLKDFEAKTSIRFLGNETVWYSLGEDVQRATRPEFRALAASGDVSADVEVYDTSVTRLSEVRDGTWKRPAHAQWHGPVFFRTG